MNSLIRTLGARHGGAPQATLAVRRAAPLAVAIAALAAACGGSAEGRGAAAEPVTPVQMAPVVPAQQSGPVSVTGTLGAKDEVTLAFKIGGVIGRVLVDDGATVRRGQVLAALDQREIDALLTKASAAADKARRDAARVERLYRDSVATLAQWQDAQTARDAAEADLRAARVNKEFATIVAPAEGTVLLRAANAGQVIGAGTPVIQFASRARGNVLRAGVPDREVVRLATGDAARVRFEALPDRVFTGRVAQIGAAADPRTGLYVVEIALSGTGALPYGLVGTATIQPRARGKGAADARRDARPAAGDSTLFAIPPEALVEGDRTHGTVFTVDASGTRARRVAVALVALDGDRVLVRGLAGVTRVVRQGGTWLSDGARVEIKP